MQIEIRHEPFDPWQELVAFQNHEDGALSGFGATTAFVGTMRDFNENENVSEMELEHYSGMTEKHLESICSAASENWDLIDILLIHRVGVVRPGEPIVLVAVWSPHRREAYEANRCIMEDLKSRAPFWKKEQFASEQRWVRSNTPG